MCIAAPGTVVSVTPDGVTIDLAGRRLRALAPEPGLRLVPGDRVVVNAGIIVRRVDREQAEAMERALRIVTGAGGPAPGEGSGEG